MSELVRLTNLERVIETGLATFQAVGEALATIRDERLYEGVYPSFEVYCVERWGFKRSRASQFILAANTANRLSTMVDESLANEGQARALAVFDVDLQAAILRTVHAYSASTGKPVTAGMIKGVGEVYADAVSTGIVEPGSGLSNPVVAAVSVTEYEATRRQAEYQREHYESHDSQGRLTAEERARRKAVAAEGTHCPRCGYKLKEETNGLHGVPESKSPNS